MISGYFADFSSLEDLSLGGNGIRNLTKDKMQGLFGLVHLSLAGNRIPSIECNTFYDSPKLRTLNLESNQLSDLPCIRSSPETWSLRELNLRGNRLTEGHNASMASHLKNVIILDLANNNIKELNNLLTEMPSLRLLWLNGNTNLRMNAAHFENSTNLAWVKFWQSGLTMVPLFGKAKQNIDYLDLGKNRFTCIDIDHISNMASMTSLNFTKNYLTLFPDVGCLTTSPASGIQDINFPKLKEIILTYNRISVFPLLPGMPLKSAIRLSHNKLLEFPPERLALLKKVDILQMQHNKAAEFPDFSQVPSYSMTDLDLSYNNISIILTNHIAPLDSLKYLRLQYNFIGNLPDMSFAYRSLKYFYIQHNLIHQLDPMILPSDKLWALTHLYASSNDITEVPSILINQFRSLIYMDISHNVLETMPCVSGVGPTLQTLLLHHNNLTHVPAECMKGLSGLRLLDLSYNLIVNFPFWIVAKGQFSSLTKMNISNNRLTYISNLESPLIPQSLRMDVRYNILNCTYQLCWLKKFHRFTLYRDDRLCASPPQFVGMAFNDISEQMLGCYCK